MSQTMTDTLNSLLRGELSACETYDLVLGNVEEGYRAAELRRLRAEHGAAAITLRQQVQQHGGTPVNSSGAWGTVAKTVEGVAKLLGEDVSIRALRAGERYGIDMYEKALHDRELPSETESVIETKLLPQTRAHIPALERMIAGAIERIDPVEARRRLTMNNGTLLICAYADPKKFEESYIEGAISRKDFEAKSVSLPKDQEIILYCD